MQSSAENTFSDLVVSSSHMRGTYIHSADQEHEELSRWNFGESSSSGAHNSGSPSGKNMEVWPSSSVHVDSGLTFSERRVQSPNMPFLSAITTENSYVQRHDSSTVSHNVNLNADIMGQIDDNEHIAEESILSKSHTEENIFTGPCMSDNSSNPSRRSGSHSEEDGTNTGTVDGRRHSCKRKAFERNIGQSSSSSSSSTFHRGVDNLWPDIPTCYEVGNSLNISTLPSAGNSRFAHGTSVEGMSSGHLSDEPESEHEESSRRNLGMHSGHSNEEAVSPSFHTGMEVRNHSPPRITVCPSTLFPHPRSSSHRLSPVAERTPHNHAVVIPVLALPESVQSFRLGGLPGLRASNFASSPFDGQESRSRGRSRSIWEHPMFMPASAARSFTGNSSYGNDTAGTVTVPSNVTSVHRATAPLDVQSMSDSSWSRHPNNSRNPRRLADYVRRALFSSGGNDFDQNASNLPQHQESFPSLEEPMQNSGPNSYRFYPRSLSRAGRQRDSNGAYGMSHPLRTFTSSSDGRNRVLLSELRGVLDLMRRGESLRFEDMLFLDQSIYFGLAELHDRHRDMRMDVDSMSYEELLALEEQIGNVSTGLSDEAITSKLKQRRFFLVGLGLDMEPCCICQENYIDAEEIGTLDCGHDFHVVCIRQWLLHKNVCPVCKMTGLGP